MALKIRLARAGAKKRPYYHVVVADSRAPRDGRYVEKIGAYNPMLPKNHKDRVVFKTDRVQYWLGVGAQPTDRVELFLGQTNLIEKKPLVLCTKKSQPKAKAQERLKEKAQAAEVARQAAAEASAPSDASSQQSSGS